MVWVWLFVLRYLCFGLRFLVGDCLLCLYLLVVIRVALTSGVLRLLCCCGLICIRFVFICWFIAALAGFACGFSDLVCGLFVMFILLFCGVILLRVVV